jgi:hypothetical protein
MCLRWARCDTAIRLGPWLVGSQSSHNCCDQAFFVVGLHALQDSSTPALIICSALRRRIGCAVPRDATRNVLQLPKIEPITPYHLDVLVPQARWSTTGTHRPVFPVVAVEPCAEADRHRDLALGCGWIMPWFRVIDRWASRVIVSCTSFIHRPALACTAVVPTIFVYLSSAAPTIC